VKRSRFLGVVVVNLAVSLFVTMAFLAFTSRMAVVYGRGAEETVTYTQEGGLDAGVVRFVMLSVTILLLQGVMSIFNLSILPYAVEDEKVNRTCIVLAVVNAVLMISLTAVMLIFNLSKAAP
jgi:hypothetical protein